MGASLLALAKSIYYHCSDGCIIIIHEVFTCKSTQWTLMNSWTDQNIKTCYNGVHKAGNSKKTTDTTFHEVCIL